MTRILDVYLHSDLVGTLIQDDGGQMQFQYTTSWLQSNNSFAISHSLPLINKLFSQKECQGFFGGILPEEKNREIIAKNLGISKENDFSMLNEIGGECAGAITFIVHNMPINNKIYGSRIISETELLKILIELPFRPLMTGENGTRLSLAGVQNKIAIRIDDDIMSIPLGNTPSTHIIKPAITEYEGIVYNEALCMKLAKKIGLDCADVSIGRAENIDFLCIKRYDRENASETQFIENCLIFPQKSFELRLHQEDFCQALGIPTRKKYQTEGGPSIKDCINLIRDVTPVSVTELQKLIDAIIFNFLIGNNDAHGKNFSLLYKNHKPFLSPLYDLICTSYYPNLSSKMAMRLGKQYDSKLIISKNFEEMADECNLSKALIRKQVVIISKKILSALETKIIDHKIADQVSDFIRNRCKNTIESFNNA